MARTLLGWGVRRITLVDNSRVAFSNPVRQRVAAVLHAAGNVWRAVARPSGHACAVKAGHSQAKAYNIHPHCVPPPLLPVAGAPVAVQL